MAFGLFLIGWIVINAIFIYNITVETGQFEVIKHSINGLASDRRIQALLIAFSFGAFIEGAAGFGTPVAQSCRITLPLFTSKTDDGTNRSPLERIRSSIWNQRLLRQTDSF